MYTLRLYHDSLPAGAVADPVDTQHAILYVLKGRPIINGKEVPADTAKYCHRYHAGQCTTPPSFVMRRC